MKIFKVAAESYVIMFVVFEPLLFQIEPRLKEEFTVRLVLEMFKNAFVEYIHFKSRAK